MRVAWVGAEPEQQRQHRRLPRAERIDLLGVLRVGNGFAPTPHHGETVSRGAVDWRIGRVDRMTCFEHGHALSPVPQPRQRFRTGVVGLAVAGIEREGMGRETFGLAVQRIGLVRAHVGRRSRAGREHRPAVGEAGSALNHLAQQLGRFAPVVVLVFTGAHVKAQRLDAEFVDRRIAAAERADRHVGDLGSDLVAQGVQFPERPREALGPEDDRILPADDAQVGVQQAVGALGRARHEELRVAACRVGRVLRVRDAQPLVVAENRASQVAGEPFREFEGAGVVAANDQRLNQQDSS